MAYHMSSSLWCFQIKFSSLLKNYRIYVLHRNIFLPWFLIMQPSFKWTQSYRVFIDFSTKKVWIPGPAVLLGYKKQILTKCYLNSPCEIYPIFDKIVKRRKEIIFTWAFPFFLVGRQFSLSWLDKATILSFLL